MATQTIQPENQKPTGNLFMSPNGQSFSNESAYINPTTVITPSSVNNTVKPFVVPQPKTPVASNGLSGAIDSSLNVFKTQQEAELQARKDAQKADKSTLDQTLQEILGTNTEIANVGNTVDRTEQDTAKKLADSYTSQIEAEQLATRRAIENIQKNNPQGLFNAGAEQEINRLNRDSLSKQADLAILQNSAIRNYDTAAAIADRQVQLKLEPLKVKAENLKLFYEANKADFNKEDDRLYNEAIKKADNELKKQEDIEKQISEIKQNVAKYAGSNASSIISRISSIDTTSKNALDEALKLGGNYAIDPLERAIKQAQLSKLNNENGGTNLKELLTIKEAQDAGVPYGTTRGQLIAKGQSSSKDSTLLASSSDKIADVEKLLTDTGSLARSAGVLRNDRFLPPGTINSTRDWRATIGNVLSGLTVTELARIKGTGVTFGALSDGERQLVANAASTLINGQIYEGTGENRVPTGRFKISEEKVKEELAKIQKYAELDFQKRNGISYQDYKKNNSTNTTDAYLNTVDTALQNTNSPYSLYLNN